MLEREMLHVRDKDKLDQNMKSEKDSCSRCSPNNECSHLLQNGQLSSRSRGLAQRLYSSGTERSQPVCRSHKHTTSVHRQSHRTLLRLKSSDVFDQEPNAIFWCTRQTLTQIYCLCLYVILMHLPCAL